MSLLLDALRRAEQDSKKRKLASAGSLVENPLLVSAPETNPAPNSPEPASMQAELEPLAELTLEAKTDVGLEPFSASVPVPALEPDAPELAQLTDEGESSPVVQQVPPDLSFGDFVLPAVDSPLPEPPTPVILPPIPPSHSYGRYNKPQEDDGGSNWEALVAKPEQLGTPAQSDVSSASANPKSLEAQPRSEAQKTIKASPYARPGAANLKADQTQAVAPPTPPMSTPRQALSAARVMAGKQKDGKGSHQQRRQIALLVVALLVALPLIAFLFFGDALSGFVTRLVSGKPLAPSTAMAPPPESAPAAPTVVVNEAAAPVAAPAAAPAAVVQETVATAASNTSSSQPSIPPSQGAATSVPARPIARATVRASVPRNRPDGSGASNARVAPLPQSAKPARPASLMDSAYAAYQAGDTAEASRLYREVLKSDATQRDAWLGLAVIAHAANQLEPAMDAYRRVLRLEPQNATALAGVSSISRAAGEPQQESRLRELLARSPQDADLNHALALVLSGEQRWSEAQLLFFKAHALAPKEPQFAYNLAVTLDHMRKTTLAAQYYETALALAQGKAAGFDELNARTRLAALRAAK